MINGDTDFFGGKVKGAAGQYIDKINKTGDTYTARLETMNFEERIVEKLSERVNDTKEEMEI